MDTRSLTGTKSTGLRLSATGHDGRRGSPISCRPSSRRASSPSSARNGTGAPGRSASSYFAGCPVTSACPPTAPSMPFSNATASSARPAVRAAGRPERRCQTDLAPTPCGVPTSRASSSSATDAIAIPSPSQITLRDTCCCARPSSPPARTSPLRHSNASFASAAYPMPSAPITAFPSPAQTPSSISKLSVWWLRLGIDIERIKPGRPQQNGRHERMHLTLKKETVRPPGANSLQQQARFDDFIKEFNTERPHEALDMKCPADVYTPSRKPYAGLPDLTYPFHDRDVLVTACGRICIYRKKINLSIVLAGQRVGIKEVDDGIWIVSFMRYDLGYIDLEAKTLQPLDNPFGPRLSPMS